jgi:hypothetical protein
MGLSGRPASHGEVRANVEMMAAFFISPFCAATFAASMMRQLAGEPGNVLLSPHSVSEALIMTMSGARTNTLEAMRTTVGVDAATADPWADSGALASVLQADAAAASIDVGLSLVAGLHGAGHRLDLLLREALVFELLDLGLVELVAGDVLLGPLQCLLLAVLFGHRGRAWTAA